MNNYLFARPSVIEGLGRIIDLGGTLQNYKSSPSPDQADASAISSDFRAVGDDISYAMAQFEESQENGKT